MSDSTTCKLCVQEKEISKSHIIPEWAYRTLYDDKHKFYELGSKPDGARKIKRKGEYENLFCTDCETQLSKLDEYARAIIFGRSDEPHFGISTTGVNGTLVIENVDYVRMKLFQLSILFRAGVSQRAFFSKVRLGTHEDRIRLMLLDENPGAPYEYGCIMVAFLNKSGKLLVEVMQEPILEKVDGHTVYKFLFAGCDWWFVVSRHSNNFKYKDCFLQRNGKLVIPLLPSRNAGFPI